MCKLYLIILLINIIWFTDYAITEKVVTYCTFLNWLTQENLVMFPEIFIIFYHV